MGVLNIIRLIKQMTDLNKGTVEQVEQLQQKRFRAMLRHAVAKSAYYRELYKGIDIETCDITDLPVVTKQEMMDNFDEFVTDRRLKRTEIRAWHNDKSNIGRMYKRKFIPFHTSGSTGENALVVYDRKGLDIVHAIVVARHALPAEPNGWEKVKLFFKALFVRRARLATVLMTGGPYPAYSAALFRPFFGQIFVNQKIFSLLDPIDKMVEELNRFQPDSIMSYPSLMEILAREQIAGRLDIKFDQQTSTVAASSEPLSATTKKLAKRAWGKDVQDTYGSSECFILARSCGKFTRMHVMTDLCILEMVDRNYNPVPDGQVGEKMLMTNLFNKVQPFIRYEISDVTGFSTESCSCSWPFPTLLAVEGRTDDIFYIDRPGGGYEPVHPYLFLGPMVEIDEVREFQLLQTGRNEVTFKYVPVSVSSDPAEKVRLVLESGMKAAGFAGRIELKLEPVESVERDAKSGKFRQIRSLVGAPEGLDDSE
jgi:phenylacetate-coenzyme A ligase PaaK-like adenylate-forming protein